jgi:CheY-like chemotaxis protein
MLGELETLPDLIISDIMMPIMDGYDFFKVVSNDPRWNTIPFLFLSVKTSPTDIIFGKLLGVDDYLIKPFKGQDLLAIIAGKISRRKRTESIKNKVKELLTSLNITPPAISVEKKKIVLIEVSWDDFYGPKLISICSVGRLNNLVAVILPFFSHMVFNISRLISFHSRGFFCNLSVSKLVKVPNHSGNICKS